MIADVRAVRRGDIKSVLPMIAKKAIATFNKLPSSERSATSIHDLISEGTIVAVTKAAKLWNPNKSAKFSTYLFAALDNYYVSVLRAAYTEQRCGSVLSADSTELHVGNGKRVYLIDLLKRSRVDRMEDSLIARIDAERGFIRAYTVASPILRKYLIRWILQPNNNQHKDGVDPQRAMLEFRAVASLHLTPELCEVIQKDFECRANIADTVLSRFYTLRPGWPSSTPKSFHSSMERDLVPILSKARQKSFAVFAEISA